MRSLPFPYDATLCERDGTEVEPVRCAVWPARGSNDGPRGRHHDHTGEAPLAAGGPLSVPNRVLRLDDGPMAGEYVILNAISQAFVPHVQLELRSRGA